MKYLITDSIDTRTSHRKLPKAIRPSGKTLARRKPALALALALALLLESADRAAAQAPSFCEPGPWTEVLKLVPSDGMAGDGFATVAMTGTTLVVGALSGNLQSSGAAYIFHMDARGFLQERQKIVPSDGRVGDLFGSGVAISGDVLVVGAPGDDSPRRNSGSAYVFERDTGGNWMEIQKLIASDARADDRFGTVAVSEDIIVVGAPLSDSANTNTGSAYVFERRMDDTWEEVATLTGLQGSNEQFGTAVAIRGDTVVVGAPSGTGAVWVFGRSAAGQWIELERLLASDGAGGRFGVSLAMDEHRLTVGAHDHLGSEGRSGAAYVFEKIAGGGWVEVDKLTAADPEPGALFGSSVALSRDRVVVGAWGKDEGGRNSGAAYIFALDSDGTWRPAQKITASDAMANERFGRSVSISNGLVVVGASGADAPAVNSGAVYLYSPVVDLRVFNDALTDPASEGSVVAGEELTYRITVLNSGPSTADVVAVRDLLPPGVTPLSTRGCAEDPLAVPICNVGRLCANEFAEYHVTIAVHPDTTGELVNQAEALSPYVEDRPGDEFVSTRTEVRRVADLAVSQTASMDTYVPGDFLSYTIEVTNHGPSDAFGSRVMNVFPDALTGVLWACVGSGGASCSLNGGGNIDDDADIPVGGMLTYSAIGRIAVGTTGAISSTATAVVSPGVTEPDAGNNSSTVVVLPKAGPSLIFMDGFESGDITAWSGTSP